MPSLSPLSTRSLPVPQDKIFGDVLRLLHRVVRQALVIPKDKRMGFPVDFCETHNAGNSVGDVSMELVLGTAGISISVTSTFICSLP